MLTPNTIRAILGESSNAILLTLLRITGNTNTGPITGLEFTNNNEDIESNGVYYKSYPFELDLPGDLTEQIPQVTLTISNVHRSIVEAVRSIVGEVNVTMEIINSNAPDVIEAGPYNFNMTTATYNALTVQGTLSYEDILNEQYPFGRFTPGAFPGLF